MGIDTMMQTYIAISRKFIIFIAIALFVAFIVCLGVGRTYESIICLILITNITIADLAYRIDDISKQL